MPAHKPTRGFALLFAVLVVSIVLTISLSLFNITYKQILLSSIVRESQVAFYAADSARNCAVHWNSFRDDTNPFGHYENGVFVAPTPGGSFVCNGQVPLNLSCLGVPGMVPVYNCSFTLVFDISGNQRACALVEVIKDMSTSEGRFQATIRSRGYNLYDGACPSQSSNRTVERAWFKTYNQF